MQQTHTPVAYVAGQRLLGIVKTPASYLRVILIVKHLALPFHTSDFICHYDSNRGASLEIRAVGRCRHHRLRRLARPECALALPAVPPLLSQGRCAWGSVAVVRFDEPPSPCGGEIPSPGPSRLTYRRRLRSVHAIRAPYVVTVVIHGYDGCGGTRRGDSISLSGLTTTPTIMLPSHENGTFSAA